MRLYFLAVFVFSLSFFNAQEVFERESKVFFYSEEKGEGDKQYLISTNSKNKDLSRTRFKRLSAFDNGSFGVNLVGQQSITTSAEVIDYKLFFGLDTADLEDNVNNCFYLPLTIISKINAGFDSIQESNALDALGYFGSPLTLRIAPVFSLTNANKPDKLNLGLFADARGLWFPDENKQDLNFIASLGGGLTYSSHVISSEIDENGEPAIGIWSISVISINSINREYLSKIFKGNQRVNSGIHLVLNIKTGNDSNAPNLSLGYQRFFQSTRTDLRSNFTLSLGI